MSKSNQTTKITLEKLKNNPDIIKVLSNEQLDELASLIRQEIIKQCSIYGGHLSSSLGVVELMVALFYVYNFPKDKLILDVGHQSYAQKILSGRSLDNLRQENGTDGFQKREESIYDCYEAGHSSTSISAAMGFALARDLKKEDYRVIALIGDSSISNGLSMEALNELGTFKHKMLIILNDNEMSIAKPVGAISNVLRKIRISTRYEHSKGRLKRFMYKRKVTKFIFNVFGGIKNFIQQFLFHKTFFEDMGLYYYGKVDGNNIKKMISVLNKVDNFDGPVILHVHTKKGKGYSFAENDTIGKYHGVSPFDIQSGEFLTKKDVNKITWSQIYADELYKAMKEDEKIVSITPATGYGSKMTQLIKDFPTRAYDVGISEEHAIIFASGLACNGVKPYVTIYSTFLQRSYDEIHHDMARMNLNVTLLLDRAGLVGDDGETHQGIYDYSYLSSIPNMTIAMARNQEQAHSLFTFSRDYNHPLIIRFPKGETERKTICNVTIDEDYFEIFNEDCSSSIISYGPIVNDLIKSLPDYQIINMVFQLPINEKTLDKVMDKKRVIIYDVYGTINGFASDVKLKLIEKGYQGRIDVLSLPNTYIKKGTINQQLKRYSCDLDSLVKLAKTEI